MAVAPPLLAVTVVAVMWGGAYAWHRSKQKRAAAAAQLVVDVPAVGDRRHLLSGITLAAIVFWALPMVLVPIRFKLGLPGLIAGAGVGLGGLFIVAHLAERRLAFGRLTLTDEALVVAIPGEVQRLPLDEYLTLRFWADHDLTGCDLEHPEGSLTLNYRGATTGNFPGVEDQRPYREGYGLDPAAGEVLFGRLAAGATFAPRSELESDSEPELDSEPDGPLADSEASQAIAERPSPSVDPGDRPVYQPRPRGMM